MSFAKRPTLHARLLLIVAMALVLGGCGAPESDDPPIAYSMDISTTQGVGFTSWVQATDDSDGVSYVLVSAPRHGFLEFHTLSGQYTYTPLPGFVGSDGFLFQAYDGVNYSDIAEVTIDVAPVVIIVVG